MPNKNIYLIRHPEVYNPNKLCYGQSEMPLEENFTVQFDWIKERLNLGGHSTYHSSPLRRCSKLASYLSDDNFISDERLYDLDFGNWEMKEWNEIPLKEKNAWIVDFVNYKMKNGERFIDLYDRAIDFYEEIISENTANDIIVVTHSGVIRSIIAHVLEFPVEKVYNLQIDFSSVSKLIYRQESATNNVAFLNLTAEN